MLITFFSFLFYYFLVFVLCYFSPWVWGYHDPMSINNTLAYGLGNILHSAMLPVYSFFKGLYADMWINVNSLWFDIKYFTFTKQTLKSIAESESGNISTTAAEIQQVVNNFSNLSMIKSIVIISTTISIVFIFIRFAQLVFSAYFLNSSTTTLTIEGLTKKIIISLLSAFLAPYIMLNGICFSAAIGLSFGKEIYSLLSNQQQQNEDSGENIVASYYYYSKAYGLSASSFCDDSTVVDRTEEEKVTEKYGPYNASSMEGNLTFPQRITPSNPKNPVEEKIWNKFCANRLKADGLNSKIDARITKPDGNILTNTWDFVIGGDFEDVSWKGTYPARIGQVLMDYDALGKEGNEGSDLFLLNYDFSFISANAFFAFIMELIFGIFVILSVTRNCLEILSLCLMSWNYIGLYVSSNRSDAIGRLAKSAGRQILNQFYICTMYGVFVSIMAFSSNFLMKIFFGIIIMITGMSGAGSIIYDVGTASGPQDFASASGAIRSTTSMASNTYQSIIRHRTISKK